MLLIMKNSNSVGEKQVLRGAIIAGWLNLCGVDVCLKVKMVKVAFLFFLFFLTFPDISDIFGKVIIANW